MLPINSGVARFCSYSMHEAELVPHRRKDIKNLCMKRVLIHANVIPYKRANIRY